MDELPSGLLRSRLQSLPSAAQLRALDRLRGFHFTEQDLPSLRADIDGGVFYVCDPVATSDVAAPEPIEPPTTGAATVPVSPFPGGLVFHSRPGAPNVIYLNFAGETVVGTVWNSDLGRSTIPAVAFSTDSDYATFSDAEQTAIKRVWQRVAEDYAAFDVDVTTQRPSSFNSRTAHALITRNTDADGAANPSSSAGGVAYVNVFAGSSYATYRPAWVYYNNLGKNEAYIAEAASHEVGHNLGLSHDGKTDGSNYYGGHGSGEISWGPLMGTGYNRNVSQWCKGEYYLANNTQDDLATLAGKLSYRGDDHGGTRATATALSFSDGTNVVSTTPESDPENLNPANKGVLERNSDVDVFSFVTGSGPIQFHADPWIMPAGTRGGNLDLVLELYSEGGILLLANNPAPQTAASIQTNVAEGRYYLQVRNSGAGDPFTASPSGYTAYGCVGQYFLHGQVTESSGLVLPPVAELMVSDLNQPEQTNLLFTVTYTDATGVNIATLDSNDLTLTGPNGYARPARFLSVDRVSNGSPCVATYAAESATGEVWTPADNGLYTIWMQTNEVANTQGAWVAGGPSGQFSVAVPTVVYAADLSTNPGWTLEGQWAYGAPAYTGGGPTGGFTGPNILGYNLSGNYGNRLAEKYVTTSPIDCTGTTTLTLRFRRWLRLIGDDTARIQVSTNGTSWSDVWSTSSTVSDSSWEEMQHSLPETVAGSPALQLRWGIESNNRRDDLGWNLDDIELLASFQVTIPTNLPGQLEVSAPGELSYSGVEGGPFFPSSRVCLLTNSGGTTLDWIISQSGNWSTLQPDTGRLDPGETVSVTVSLNTNATDLMAGSYSNAITFLNTTTGLGDTDRSLQLTVTPPPTFQLTTIANVPIGGTVSPASGAYPAGTAIELTAIPAPYFWFQQWTGDVTATNNPVSVVISSNLSVMAAFGELMTTIHPTPHWWLAGLGYTNDFESAVTQVGANGMKLWESYVAGLDPDDPASQLRLSFELGDPPVLRWQPVSNRTYTVQWSTNGGMTFSPLEGATDLPALVSALTNESPPSVSTLLYRLEVQKP